MLRENSGTPWEPDISICAMPPVTFLSDLCEVCYVSCWFCPHGHEDMWVGELWGLSALLLAQMGKCNTRLCHWKCSHWLQCLLCWGCESEWHTGGGDMLIPWMFPVYFKQLYLSGSNEFRKLSMEFPTNSGGNMQEKLLDDLLIYKYSLNKPVFLLLITSCWWKKGKV